MHLRAMCVIWLKFTLSAFCDGKSIWSFSIISFDEPSQKLQVTIEFDSKADS